MAKASAVSSKRKRDGGKSEPNQGQNDEQRLREIEDLEKAILADDLLQVDLISDLLGILEDYVVLYEGDKDDDEAQSHAEECCIASMHSARRCFMGLRKLLGPEERILQVGEKVKQPKNKVVKSSENDESQGEAEQDHSDAEEQEHEENSAGDQASIELENPGPEVGESGEAVLTKWVANQRRDFAALLLRLSRAPRSSCKILETAVAVSASIHDGWERNMVSMTKYAVQYDSENASFLRHFLGSKMIARYHDVCFRVLNALAGLCRSSSKESSQSPSSLCENMIHILMAVNMPATSEQYVCRLLGPMLEPQDKDKKTKKQKTLDQKPDNTEIQDNKNAYKALRKAYSDCWLSLLTLELSANDHLRILQELPTRVLPVMSQPLRFSDYLTEAYNRGGNFALLALNGLFMLIAKHGLDYPLFYHKLYALLTPDMFLSDHHEKFMHLVSQFVISRFLPGYLVASFVKRFVRRALFAPAYAVPWCLRMAAELIRRHPSVHCLVHRTASASNEIQTGLNFFDPAQSLAPPSKGAADTSNLPSISNEKGVDPFDDSEIDPAKSGALQSSLWEVETLRHHFNPAVVRMCDMFSVDVRRVGTLPPPPPPPGGVDDYAMVTYENLFASDAFRRTKEVPMAYKAPATDSNTVFPFFA